MLFAILLVLGATHAEDFWGDAYPEVNASTTQQSLIYETLINNDSLWTVSKEQRIQAIKDAVYSELGVTPSDRSLNEKTVARRKFIQSVKDSSKANELLAVWDTQIWAGSLPEITIVGSDTQVLKDSVWEDPGATALDVVDGELPVVVVSTVDTSTVGLYTVIYTATDEAGQSTSALREVSVYEVIEEEVE